MHSSAGAAGGPAAAGTDKDFDVGVEWFMAQYAATDSLDLRLGRVVLPGFMISDSRNVTYTQPWLRAPLQVYGQLPLTTLDGLQASWRIPVGASVFTIQPSFGKSYPNYFISNTVFKPPYSRVSSLNATWEYGSWLARVGQVRGDNDKTSLALAPGLVPEVDIKDKFTDFGVQFDNGSAVVMAEYATRRTNNVSSTFPIPSARGTQWGNNDYWYVAGGWRFGKWLPMLAYGKNTNNLPSPTTSTTGTDLSLRYDLMTNVALKAQFSRYQSKDGTVFVAPTTAANDHKVNIFSAGLDFVF